MRHLKGDRVPNWALGALVLVAIAVLFYSAFNRALPPPLGSLLEGERHTYKLAFRDAGGIVPGISPVRVAGVNVGKVEGTEPGPGAATTVVVEVGEAALPLHTDATAQVRPRTFLEGNFFVDLHPGSPSAPLLEDGGGIPVNQTYGSVQLDQILGTFTHGVRRDLRAGVRGLGAAVGGRAQPSLRAAAPKLAPLFSDISRVSEAARGLRVHDLSQAIGSTSRVAAALARQRPQLGRLVSSFSTVAVALADRDAQLRAALARLPGVLAEARPALADFNAAFPQLRALVRELRPALRAAPPVLRTALPFTRQASALLSRRELPRLVRFLRPAVVDLVAAAPRLENVLRMLRPTSTCLVTTVAPTLLAEVPDGDLSTGDPAYQDLAHAVVGLTSASQNFDGNGYSLRYNAGFNDEVLSLAPGSPLSLIGFGEEAPLGSRPDVPNQLPPLRDDVPCTAAGGPPDLSSPTGAGDFQPTGRRLRLRIPADFATRSLQRRLDRALRRELP